MVTEEEIREAIRKIKHDIRIARRKYRISLFIGGTLVLFAMVCLVLLLFFPQWKQLLGWISGFTSLAVSGYTFYGFITNQGPKVMRLVLLGFTMLNIAFAIKNWRFY